MIPVTKADEAPTHQLYYSFFLTFLKQGFSTLTLLTWGLDNSQLWGGCLVHCLTASLAAMLSHDNQKCL